MPQSPWLPITSFARLVSLACHDVRTPLATVHGFVKTLERTMELEPPTDRYMEMIGEASVQMAELLDELSLVGADRVGPLRPGASRGRHARARARRARSGSARTACTSPARARSISTDVEAVGRGVSALVQSVLRHGGLDEVGVVVRGTEIDVSPVTPASAQVVLGEELRDLGAAVAVRLVAALGGAVTLDGETLTIRLAAA